MKKFIIAICGSFLLFDCAHARIDIETHKDAIKRWEKEWIADSSIYTFKEGGEDVKGNYEIKTYSDDNDFQYVNIVAAMEMYEHGAKFCRIQLQHNWGDWKVYIEPHSCRTFCKEGHYGTECNTNSLTVKDCEYSDLTEIFNSAPYYLETIDGFRVSDTYATILEAVSVTKRRIDVALVNFSGDDKKLKKISTISGAKNKLSLCVQGYELKNGECVISETCNNEWARLSWCGDWDDDIYNENDHELVKVGDCKQYRCKGTKGFEPRTHNCISCATTLTQRVNADGVCEQCNDGQMFTNDGCKPYKKLSALQLKKGFQGIFDCWQELGSDNYKKCVLCESPKSYNKTEKTCRQ